MPLVVLPLLFNAIGAVSNFPGENRLFSVGPCRWSGKLFNEKRLLSLTITKGPAQWRQFNLFFLPANLEVPSATIHATWCTGSTFCRLLFPRFCANHARFVFFCNQAPIILLKPRNINYNKRKPCLGDFHLVCFLTTQLRQPRPIFPGKVQKRGRKGVQNENDLQTNIFWSFGTEWRLVSRRWLV